MSVEVLNNPVARIGATAGKVWHFLEEHGPISVTGLAQELEVPRDLVMQAIGWLAREDKVEITEEGRTKTIYLKSN
jgi:predicted ArsR family transcriptional regulator